MRCLRGPEQFVKFRGHIWTSANHIEYIQAEANCMIP